MANTNQGGKSQGDLDREKSQSGNVNRSSSEKENVKRNPSMSDEDREGISGQDEKSGETKRENTGSIGSEGRTDTNRDQRNR
jgi:hypothetical protein